jgi:hypothetical protein
MSVNPEKHSEASDGFRVVGVLTVWAALFGGGVFFFVRVLGLGLLPSLIGTTAALKGVHHVLADKLRGSGRK